MDGGWSQTPVENPLPASTVLRERTGWACQLALEFVKTRLVISSRSAL